MHVAFAVAGYAAIHAAVEADRGAGALGGAFHFSIVSFCRLCAWDGARPAGNGAGGQVCSEGWGSGLRCRSFCRIGGFRIGGHSCGAVRRVEDWRRGYSWGGGVGTDTARHGSHDVAHA
jgi:hypothetical protein